MLNTVKIIGDATTPLCKHGEVYEYIPLKSNQDIVDGALYCFTINQHCYIRKLYRFGYFKIKAVSPNRECGDFVIDFSEMPDGTFELLGEIGMKVKAD